LSDIRGILPAILTPFDQDGQLNLPMLRRVVRFQMEAGVAGFFVNGGTGEGLLLDPAERRLSLETVLNEVDSRLPVIAHVGAIATHVAADLAAHAAAVGATAVAAIPPIYFRVDLPALKVHYQQIAQAAAGLPVWLYHIPGATGVTITPEMLAELLEIEQIRGLKYTSYDFFSMRKIIEMVQDRPFTLLSGPDELCLPALVMGAQGAIGTTYNMLPGHFVRLYDSLQRGDLKQAQTLQFEANRVIKALTSVSTLAALKEVMAHMGFDCGEPRRPLRPLSSAEKDKLWQAMSETSVREMVDVPITI
jgi:N-acetylneuraminate lyase